MFKRGGLYNLALLMAITYGGHALLAKRAKISASIPWLSVCVHVDAFVCARQISHLSPIRDKGISDARMRIFAAARAFACRMHLHTMPGV